MSPLTELQKTRSHSLRQQSTDAEQLLWRHLRNRQLGNTKFRRQYPLGPYYLDFYCKETRLCIELDGGGHLEPDQLQKDIVRTRFLEDNGIHVIRFWNNDVLAHIDLVLEAILNEIRSINPHFPE